MIDRQCALQCAFFSVHFLGLAAAVCVRVSAGRRAEAWWESAFLACLAVVGVCALAGPQVGATLWRFSAGTLALMLVAAVVDFRSEPSGP